MLFLTSELANKAEMTILSARDTTKAWLPGQSIMGNDIGVYKTRYNTWLSSRPQNQPRSLFGHFFSRYHASSLVGSATFAKAFVGSASHCMELEPWFLPRFPAHLFPTGVFPGRFFLASIQTACALLAVAQLY